MCMDGVCATEICWARIVSRAGRLFFFFFNDRATPEFYPLSLPDALPICVVLGTQIEDAWSDDRLATRLDFDQAFGTAVNRFCCQAVIDHPLTPFGKGRQKRGFLPLRDRSEEHTSELQSQSNLVCRLLLEQ